MNDAEREKDDLLMALVTQNVLTSEIQSCFFSWCIPNEFFVYFENNPGQVGFVSLGGNREGRPDHYGLSSLRFCLEGLGEPVCCRACFRARDPFVSEKRDEGMKGLGVQVECRKLVVSSKKGTKRMKTFWQRCRFSVWLHLMKD